MEKQKQVTGDTPLKLELNVNEINIVCQGLGELPLKWSQAVLAKVQAQINLQVPQAGVKDLNGKSKAKKNTSGEVPKSTG